MDRQKSTGLLGTVLALLCLCGVGSSQDSVSPEVMELRVALKVTQQKLAESERKRKAVVQSLAEAVRVSEEQTFAAREVQEKLEAFGVDLFRSSKDSLEQRLLRAVRDLDIARQESERQRKSLHELSEAFLKYIAATGGTDEKAREEARLAIEKASGSLSDLVESDPVSRKLEESRVVSVNEEIGLVVLDAGRQSGVRVGTPITINREERPIFTAMVVDVRESISGALLQEKVSQSDSVKVGDEIRPLVTETEF